MGLVIESVFALGVILLALWLWSLRASIVRDQAEARRRQEEEQAAQEQAGREAKLHRKGEKLHCLGCGTTFPGPLSDTGCPQCHLSSLVVTKRDYLRQQQGE